MNGLHAEMFNQVRSLTNLSKKDGLNNGLEICHTFLIQT